MLKNLPRDAIGTLDWSWPQFEMYYADLIRRPLKPENVSEFLTDWTALSELVDETHSRLHVAITGNTADKWAEIRYHRFLDEIYPMAEEAEQKLKTRLLAQSTVPEGFEIPLMKIRVDAELFRQENLPLKTQEQKLCNQYDKIIGAQTVQWEGKEVTLVQLRPVFQSQDRELRGQAWRLASQRQLHDRKAVGDLWRRFMDLRVNMATNAGFSEYRSFRWKEFHRFDYGPEDCKAFHKAIEEVVVPAAARVAEKRRKRLGVPALRPWDMEVDPFGRPPLRPFKTVSELQNGVSSVFHRVDARLASYFDTMVSEGLLDLDNRKNKAPGGYCTEFAAMKRPFIFMNAVGVHDDVQTLLHESGHAFHAFERNHLPYYQQRHVGMEFSEVASMAMELLASPYLARENGGFYDKADAARALVEHLERSIRFWPYMAVVDAFQHWVYENPGIAKDPSKCDDQWARLWNRFITWIDWTGLDEELMIGWQLKLHIYTVPFYYVEYGLAQLGAVQVWGNALKDQAAAVASYRAALALGGTVALPQLFSRAGARFAFDAATLKAAVDLMERTIESLEESA
jgi:oligoendopeptidase F